MSVPMTATNIEIGIVQDFHDRLNARDPEGVLALAADDVRVGGPRGSGTGKHLLEEWIGRASITMTPMRWFYREGTVIVEERAVWHTPDGSEETGGQIIATIFELSNGQITGIARYGNIGEAVTSADMDETNEIPPPGDMA